jgi:hypothetical protein
VLLCACAGTHRDAIMLRFLLHSGQRPQAYHLVDNYRPLYGRLNFDCIREIEYVMGKQTPLSYHTMLGSGTPVEDVLRYMESHSIADASDAEFSKALANLKVNVEPAWFDFSKIGAYIRQCLTEMITRGIIHHVDFPECQDLIQTLMTQRYACIFNILSPFLIVEPLIKMCVGY